MLKKRYASKKDFVVAALRDRICSGKLAPGTRLIIEDLAAEFDVSPIPVREALQLLAAEGFVDFKAHVGARVSTVRREEINEVFALLESLEIVSGRAACERITPDHLAALHHMLEQMDRHVDRQATWSEKNLLFHREICAIADYQLTQTLFDRVQVHWDRIRHSFLKDVFLGHLPEAQREHWQIYAALERHDADAYESIIRRHNQSARQAYLAIMQKSE